MLEINIEVCGYEVLINRYDEKVFNYIQNTGIKDIHQ